MAYRNLVEESSTSTSGSSITIAGAAAGMLTFAAQYGVGAKRIPVYFGSTAAWMVCQCTLTSSTSLSVDKILKTSLGNTTPPTFSAGTKRVYACEPAEFLNPQFVDLREFDVDPTFSNDSTAGVQAAIQAAYDGGGPIRCPVGRFAISGPRVGSGNCQLYIPQTREAAHDRSVYFEGAHAPNFQQQGLRNVTAPNNGTIFESTLTAASVSGTNPALIGGEQGNSGDAWVWNYTNFGMRNMCLRTTVAAAGGAANPLSALNMQFLSQVNILDMLRIDISRGLQDMVSPEAGSCGIIMPPVDNHLMLNMGAIYVSGYNNCVIFQEHTVVQNLISIGNINGIVLKGANHGSFVGMYQPEWNRNAIVMDGTHDLHIGTMTAEHNGGTNFSFANDLKYNAGTGIVSFGMATTVVPGVGRGANFTTDAAAARYKILSGLNA